MSKKKGDTLIMIVTTRQSMGLVGLQVQIVSIRTYPDWSVLLIILCTIRIVHPCLM